MKRSTATLVLAIATTPLLSGAAVADGQSPNCPQGYTEESVEFVLGNAAEGFEDDIVAMDKNEDGLLCYKEIPAPLFEPVTFIYYDNDVQQLGKP